MRGLPEHHTKIHQTVTRMQVASESEALRQSIIDFKRDAEAQKAKLKQSVCSASPLWSSLTLRIVKNIPSLVHFVFLHCACRRWFLLCFAA